MKAAKRDRRIDRPGRRQRRRGPPPPRPVPVRAARADPAGRPMLDVDVLAALASLPAAAAGGPGTHRARRPAHRPRWPRSSAAPRPPSACTSAAPEPAWPRCWPRSRRSAPMPADDELGRHLRAAADPMPRPRRDDRRRRPRRVEATRAGSAGTATGSRSAVRALTVVALVVSASGVTRPAADDDGSTAAHRRHDAVVDPRGRSGTRRRRPPSDHDWLAGGARRRAGPRSPTSPLSPLGSTPSRRGPAPRCSSSAATENLCPPYADCLHAQPLLVDGAAYSPADGPLAAHRRSPRPYTVGHGRRGRRHGSTSGAVRDRTLLAYERRPRPLDRGHC